MSALRGEASRSSLSFAANFALAAAVVAGSDAGTQRAAAQHHSMPYAKLAELLPAEPGRKACYVRGYDAAHLRDHPKQCVTSVTFFLRVVGLDANGDKFFALRAEPYDRIQYEHVIALTRRGTKRKLSAGGYCSGDVTAQCAVECDAGGLTLEKAGADALLIRLLDEGIEFDNDCDGGKGTRVKPGADDRVFRVDKVSLDLCRALEKSELGKEPVGVPAGGLRATNVRDGASPSVTAA